MQLSRRDSTFLLLTSGFFFVGVSLYSEVDADGFVIRRPPGIHICRAAREKLNSICFFFMTTDRSRSGDERADAGRQSDVGVGRVCGATRR